MAEGAEDADFQPAADLPGGPADPEPRDEVPPRPPGAGSGPAPGTPSRRTRARPPGDAPHIDPPTFAALAENAGVDGDVADAATLRGALYLALGQPTL
eukprot:10479220-Lingulodinium_polyedra.AAC.1